MGKRIGAAVVTLAAIVGGYFWSQHRERSAVPGATDPSTRAEAAEVTPREPDALDADGWPSVDRRPWDVRWRAPSAGADGGSPPWRLGLNGMVDIGEMSALAHCRGAASPESVVTCDDDGWLLRLEEDKTGDGEPEVFVLSYEENRLIEQTEDRGGDGTVDYRTTFTYDDQGRPTGHEWVDEQSGELIGEQRVRYSGSGRMEVWNESPGPEGSTLLQVFVDEQLVEHYQQSRD